MMTVNYHTHTTRCRHATNTEREYIESAIRNGIKVLGFADHAPYIFHGPAYENFRDGKYYSNFRMFPEQAEDYFRTLTDLKAEYKNEIEIHIGLECEYYPMFFEKTYAFWMQFPCEYMILGQHMLDNEIGKYAQGSAAPDASAERFEDYLRDVTEGMATGKFLYLAHPDVLHFTGDPAIQTKMDEKLCLAAKTYNVPLEMNMLGMRLGRHYPRKSFWETAARVGNRVTIGADAHCPEVFDDETSYKKVLQMADEAGVRIEYLKLNTILNRKERGSL